MPHDWFAAGSRRLVPALGAALCLGALAIGSGCSPATEAGARSTPARLKAMQKNGRAVITNQGARPASKSRPR